MILTPPKIIGNSDRKLSYAGEKIKGSKKKSK